MEEGEYDLQICKMYRQGNSYSVANSPRSWGSVMHAEKELANAIEESRKTSEQLQATIVAMRNSIFAPAYDAEKVDERIRKGESLG